MSALRHCFANPRFDLKKFVMRPSLERFFFWAAPKDDAFLVAELHGLPHTGTIGLSSTWLRSNFRGQFVAKHFRMVRGCTRIAIPVCERK